MEHKTVRDFMAEFPPSFNHERIYTEGRNGKDGKPCAIDMNEWEFSTLGLGEKNIIHDLLCPDSFILDGMDDGFEVNVQAFAKKQSSDHAKGALTGEKVYTETFAMENSVTLITNDAEVWEPPGKGLALQENQELHSQLLGLMIGTSATQQGGGAMTVIGEKMTWKQDLRHLFVKGYLMLHAFNLAVTSGKNDVYCRPTKVRVVENPPPEQKMALLMRERLVIKASNFRSNELRLLMDMASEYPNRRYGETWNVYSNVKVAADDLLVITDEEGFVEPESYTYSSPERMLYLLVSIALRLNALEDLYEVFRGMRGMPFLMKHYSELVGSYVFTLKYPRSTSIKNVLDSFVNTDVSVSKHSNYYATSKCLLADNYVGQMIKMAAFSIVEELGYNSQFLRSQDTPFYDPIFNSTMRNMGLRVEDEAENRLLEDWHTIRQCSLPFSTPKGIKAYVGEMAEKLATDGGRDFVRPQILFAIPFTPNCNTTWATIRGYVYSDVAFSQPPEKRVEEAARVRAFTFAMGISEELPQVGRALIGVKNPPLLSAKEYEFIKLAKGEYKLCMVKYSLVRDASSRVDDYGLGPEVFYKSHFPGTLATVVFMKGNVTRVIKKTDDRYNDPDTMIDTMRERPKKDFSTKEGDPKNKAAEVLNKEYGPKKGADESGEGGGNGGPDKLSPISEGSERGSGGGDTPTTSGGDKPEGDVRSGSEPAKDKDSAPQAETDRGGKRQEERASKEKNDTMGGQKRTDGGSKTGTQQKNGPPRMTSNVRSRKDREVEIIEDNSIKVYPSPKLVDGRVPIKRIDLGHRTVDYIYDATLPRVTGNTLKGHVVPTIGDGKCGIHAITQYLDLCGYLGEVNYDTAFQEMWEAVGGGAFHDDDVLGAIGNSLNMDVVVYDSSERSGRRYVVPPGVVSNGEIYIYYSKGPDHYSTFLRDERNGSVYKMEKDVFDLPVNWTDHIGKIVTVNKYLRRYDGGGKKKAPSNSR